MAELNDSQLVKNYLSGNEKALEALIRRYLRPVFSFSYKFVHDQPIAEDITQEVFVKVWKNIKKFDTKKNFKAWIFTIAKNTALDFIKRKKTIPFSSLGFSDNKDISEIIPDGLPGPDEIFDGKKSKNYIFSLIDKLSPLYRAVLFLKYKNDFTFAEIAEVLDEPLNTVKSRHRRGVAALKKLSGQNAPNTNA